MATDSALLDVETEDFIGKLGIPPLSRHSGSDHAGDTGR